MKEKYTQEKNSRKVFYENIGHYIKEQRVKKNIGEDEMARKCQIPFKTYDSYERGARKLPLDLFIYLQDNLKFTLADEIIKEASKIYEEGIYKENQ